MDAVYLMLLAFIQGLSEFLPVSSSGHLVLLPHLLNFKDQGLVVDVALHVGTLFAVILYFRKDIALMMKDFYFYTLSGFNKERYTPFVRLSLCLIVGTLPVVFFGMILKNFMPSWFRSPLTIAFTSAFFGIILYAVDRFSKKTTSLNNMTYKQAFMIGTIQCLALVPGTSRSGSCMWAARLLGFDRIDASKFSFLLSLPAITAAALLTFLDVLKTGETIAYTQLTLAIGVSFCVGLLAIHFLLEFVKNNSFKIFMIYRLMLSAFLLWYFL